MKIGTRLWNRRRKILLTLSWDTQRKKNTANLSYGTTPFVTLEETIWLIDNTTSPLWDLGLQDAGSGTNFKKKPQIHDESKAKKNSVFQDCCKENTPFINTHNSKIQNPTFYLLRSNEYGDRPPIKNGHKPASGHITVCNSHSWLGYLTMRHCEHDCKGITNPCLDC